MLAVNDTLDAILLGAFFFGIIFTAVSLALGAAHIGLHSFEGHTPHGLELGHGGHGGHGGHVGHGAGDGHGGHGHGGEMVSHFTIGSVLAFLTWFGGVAYLARTSLGLFAIAAIMVGLVAGLAGGWLVYRVLRVMVAHGDAIDPEVERVAMAFGQVLTSIRAGGTGEIVYQNRGVRQTIPARSVNDDGIPAGAEVIVLQRTAGFALVQRWDGVLDEADTRAIARPTTNGTHDPQLTAGDSA